MLPVLLPRTMLGGWQSYFTGRPPEDLGVVDGKLHPCPGTPNCVSSFETDPRHAIDPLQFTEAPATAFDRLREVLQSWPRTTIVTAAWPYLHATVTTRWLRFVDDLEFLVDEAAGVIHVRSAARTGTADFGVNRARLEKIRAAFLAAQQKGEPPASDRIV